MHNYINSQKHIFYFLIIQNNFDISNRLIFVLRFYIYEKKLNLKPSQEYTNVSDILYLII